MKDRSRLYNSITLTMVALSASLCTIVLVLSLGRLAGSPAVASGPILVQSPSQTATLSGPELNAAAPPDSTTPLPRPTRVPRPTWTPLPTDTLPPGETSEPLANFDGVPTIPPDAPPLGYISIIPTTRDVPEVALEVDLHYSTRWARVEQTIQVRNYSNDAWDEIVFSIPLAALSGFALDSAAAGSPEQPVDAKLDGIMLHVPLPRPVPPGLLARVNLNFRVAVADISTYTSFPEGNNGFSGGVLRLSEWYPVIAPYHTRTGWEMWAYRPIGDPTIYPAANTTLAVSATPGVTVVSGGFSVREGNVWHFRVEGARAMPIFASDNFQMVEGTVDNMPVRCYTVGVNRAAANGAIDVARNALALYKEAYGPYPYKSLDIVENGYTGDMEYSALVSISDRGFVTFQDEVTEILHVLLAHEIAHQWWYGGVGNDQVFEPWLDESLATYSEILYYDRYFSQDPNPRLISYRSRDLGTTLDLSIYDYPTAVQYKEGLYPRGAVFIANLRALIGDNAFFTFLQDYQAQYRGKLATTTDFFTVLRRHTTADLTPMLDAYFSDPNH